MEKCAVLHFSSNNLIDDPSYILDHHRTLKTLIGNCIWRIKGTNCGCRCLCLNAENHVQNLLNSALSIASNARASISQDYWGGDIKEDWASKDPSGVQGWSPGKGSRNFINIGGPPCPIGIDAPGLVACMSCDISIC